MTNGLDAQISQIVMQLGIAGVVMYMFYKYAELVTQKMMNGALRKLDNITEREDKILTKLEIILEKLDEKEKKR